MYTKSPLYLLEKRRTKKKQERKILFQFDSTEMSTHSFIHRCNISIALENKKKKKEEE